MAPRVRNKEETRARLLAAGQAAAHEAGLSNLRIADVLDRADASKGAFFHHFADREAFVVAMHDAFHERMDAALEPVLAAHEPGRDRLLAAASAYWEFCISERAVRAILMEARSHPEVAERSRAHTAAAAARYAEDLGAMGVEAPLLVARLLVAAATEVALTELETGRRSNAIRRVFERLIPAG